MPDLSEIKGKVFGLVVPHAGHRYSGATAGIAYRTILGNTYPLVIILSPSHAYYPAELLSSAHLFYATPLGKIPIHQEALELASAGIERSRQRICTGWRRMRNIPLKSNCLFYSEP